MLPSAFSQAARGIKWAFQEIQGAEIRDNTFFINSFPLEFREKTRQTKSFFQIRVSARKITISAPDAVCVIGALLELAEQSYGKAFTSLTKNLKFRTRFYKKEIRFNDGTGNKHSERWGTGFDSYSQETVESLCRELVKRHFNSLVLYCGHHPFEFFLDYNEFSEAPKVAKNIRRKNLNALKRLVNTASDYGLDTYLHHYVSHFPAGLRKRLKAETAGSLSGFEHSIIDQYTQYAYARTFELLPGLTGLFMNFESSGDTAAFMDRNLIQQCNRMKKKPVLFFRLWGLSRVDEMKWLLDRYKGRKGVVHKSHDTNDTYYYPEADERIRDWKRAMPDLEFAYSMGPCHNCGTNISRLMWSDPDYVQRLCESMEKKGADSVSFQSIYELLIKDFPDPSEFEKAEVAASRANQGHIQAFVDYVRDEKPSPGKWAERYAEWFGVSEKAGGHMARAIQSSSRIILDHFTQFCYGSPQEGYLYPGRFSFYQEPFFYYPMSFLNRIGEIKNLSWRSWVVRDKRVRVLPDDTQHVIDYVNPSVRKKAKNSPSVISRRIRRNIRLAENHLEKFIRESGKRPDDWTALQFQDNRLNGEKIRHEIDASIELYSCYFAKSKKEFFSVLKKTVRILNNCAKVLGKESSRINAKFRATTHASPFTPAKDAEEISQIIPFQKEAFPFEALQCYVRSHERYNEIRRMFRPYAGMDAAAEKRNRTLLSESLTFANRAMELLAAPEHALYRDNVLAWTEYVRAEIDWLRPPAMECVDEKELGRDEGFRTMVHDQCYRWGEKCWIDFSSFFKRYNFFREDYCDCRAVSTSKGLKLSLREHDIDWPQREKVWEQNKNSVNAGGFMQVMLSNPGRRGCNPNYTIFFKGEGGTVSGRKPGERRTFLSGITCDFTHTDSSWRFDLTIPWKQLGGKPGKGNIWRMNILSNPSVTINRRVIWSQTYEWRGDRTRLGYLVFR